MTDLRALAIHALGIAVGYAQAGTFETDPNRGDQIEFFQHTTGGSAGESWCADFVYACLLKADCKMKGLLVGATDHDNRVIMLNHANAMSAATGIPRTGYCPTVASVAKTKGRFHTKNYRPGVGDLILYDFNNVGEPHHIGFVRGVNVDGTLRTVEGNTSASSVGSQANGDGVYMKVRPRTHVYGFVSFS